MRVNDQPGTLSTVGLAVVYALLALQPISAWAEPAGARYRVVQPSQPLSDALKAIAKQTNSSVLFDPGAVGQRLSQPVTGEFSGAEAISRALEGTGLTAEVMKDGSIVVKPRAALTLPHSVAAQAGSLDETTTVGGTSAARATLSIQLAQAPAAGQIATDAGTGRPTDGREEDAKPQRLEITGSRIKRVETDAAMPINVYTREDIEKSGQPTLGRFLSSLNEVPMSGGEGGIGPLGGQATVQLRGLPLGTTLVLINGRRVESVGSSAGGNFFNLNLIPLAAVERVEILPVGSSAVYGGDALAGVVNIVLKKTAEGVGAELRNGSAKGTEDGSLSLTAGGTFGQGRFLLLGALSKRTPLHMGEREFFKDADFRRFGGPDARARTCTPGTVSSNTATNLPGLNSTFAGIPSTVPGQTLSMADFEATAGSANLCNDFASGNGLALAHGTETAALHATADYHLAGEWTVFGELTYTDDRLSATQRGLSLNNVLVPATNAFNPFGVPVRVTERLGMENGAEGFARKSKFTRVFVGARGDLAEGWDVEATAGTARDETLDTTRNDSVNAAARTAALASSTPAMALNPFTSGSAASEEVLSGIWSDVVRAGEGRRDQVNVFVRGSALALPAGAVDVVAGAEWQRDEWKSISTAGGVITSNRHATRSIKALFAEARLPVISATSDSGRKFELATLTAAGRRDSYSDFGSANTYQAGLEVRPARSALLRAATATSFKPPSLLQVSVAPRTFTTELFGLTDPRAANAPIVGGQVVLGPNPDLRPETGKALTLGAAWEPDVVSGFRLGVTGWHVKLRDQIALIQPQTVLNFESLFPGLVTRGPSVGGAPGPVTAVRQTYVNFGEINVSGTDLEAAYTLPTALGKWSFSASATRTSKYDVVLAPGAPVDTRLGRRNLEAWAPEWKGRLGAGLDRGAWSLGVVGRYLGGYKDAGTSVRELGGTWTFDLSASVDLNKLSPAVAGAVKSATLSAAIVNVGDKLPQFAGSTQPFYDHTQADWRGRYASVRLAIGW